MTNKNLFLLPVILVSTIAIAQQKAPGKTTPTTPKNEIPVSNAELGTFPYFKTFPNFSPTNVSDSTTDEANLTYFYNGKTYFTVEGQVSFQKLNVVDDKQKLPSEFQIVQEFDKMVSTLGGKKVYQGPMPPEDLKKFAGKDLVDLSSKHQVVASAWYGVNEYVIKTPDKEVWIQLVAATIASHYYTVLIVEKQSKLLTTNINKKNNIMDDLVKGSKSVVPVSFAPDSDTLLTVSKDELMNIVGVLQAHPDWKLQIEVFNATVGKPEYTKALTDKRALVIKSELSSLGASAIVVKGMGDTRQLLPNDTEAARIQNTRIEIIKL